MHPPGVLLGAQSAGAIMRCFRFPLSCARCLHALLYDPLIELLQASRESAMDWGEGAVAGAALLQHRQCVRQTAYDSEAQPLPFSALWILDFSLRGGHNRMETLPGMGGAISVRRAGRP